MKLRELPIGIQTFELICKKDSTLVYVDKTREIYELAKGGEKRYFLSRPRRFGKSLLCSTLKSLFEGRKDLFEGLWIVQSDWQWEKHPIVHLDFNLIARSSPDQLRKGLIEFLQEEALQNHIVIDSQDTLTRQLTLLIKALAQQNKVIVIIDEYDKVILDHISNIPIAVQMREILKELYTAFKGLDQYLRFIFITGVTKFAKTSIFSGINNLQDISLSSIAATVCGFTYEELVNNFQPFIHALAEKRKLPKEEIIDQLRRWYNGYSFDTDEEKPLVYNPFSILLALQNKKFQNYWFESGTPTFLINLIKQNNYPIMDFQTVKIAATQLASFEIEKIRLDVLMQQTGYLTIIGYDEASENYTATYPNFEVFKALAQHIVPMMTKLEPVAFNDYVVWFRQALQAGDIEHFCKTLKQFFTEIPYTIAVEDDAKKPKQKVQQITVEKYYQTIFFVICRLLTRQVWVEQATNIGRIDCVLEFEDRVIIIEFKVNDSAQAALDQIKDRGYAQAYHSSGKQIVLVGINFDSQIRNITNDWIVEIMAGV
ncbi:ATP-binding protein [Candidatus Dependentiae bacterium]|nr:ATP-binding protein [Candidatus Dependentiae bacterium]